MEKQEEVARELALQDGWRWEKFTEESGLPKHYLDKAARVCQLFPPFETHIASLNITEAAQKACEQPTLLEALSWICVWESERVVKQARENPQWDTCFTTCLKAVMDNFAIKGIPALSTEAFQEWWDRYHPNDFRWDSRFEELAREAFEAGSIEEGQVRLPTISEIKEWWVKNYYHLNPDLKDYLLMGVEALYTHLGGKKFLHVIMPGDKH